MSLIKLHFFRAGNCMESRYSSTLKMCFNSRFIANSSIGMKNVIHLFPNKQNKNFCSLIRDYSRLFEKEKTNNSDQQLSKQNHKGTSTKVGNGDPILEEKSLTELKEIISHLSSLPKNSTEYFEQLLKVDRLCCLKLKSWDKKTCFHVLQVMRHNNIANLDFHRQALKLWETEIFSEEISPSEIVTYLNCIGNSKFFPITVNIQKLEERLFHCFDKFTVKDLGVICEAFFRCEKGINSIQLLDRMVGKLLENITTVEDRTLNSMLKLFRKSTVNVGHYSKAVIDLQRNVYDYIPTWNSMTLIQLISLGTGLLYFHLPTIERVVELFINSMHHIRLKDMERLTTVLAISCHCSLNVNRFYDVMTAELVKEERQAEIQTFARSLISLTSYCIVAGHFPDELLRIALRPDIILSALKATDYNSTQRELMMLHRSLEIEHPNYVGPKLSSKDVIRFTKLFQKPFPNNPDKPSNYERFLLALLDTTQVVLGGQEFAKVAYLQPHFSLPDITFSLDHQRRWIPVDLDVDCHQKFAMLAGMRNFYRNSKSREDPMGLFRMKIRQLELTGHRVIIIPWTEFVFLNSEARAAYIRKMIFTNLKSQRPSRQN